MEGANEDGVTVWATGREEAGDDMGVWRVGTCCIVLVPPPLQPPQPSAGGKKGDGSCTGEWVITDDGDPWSLEPRLAVPAAGDGAGVGAAGLPREPCLIGVSMLETPEAHAEAAV
mmetsp:Transcript_55804/g.155592  ORF Transcript_55804/g.155592 Transcript_55804/m.155592 type:complete len:115 (-) Transcript_55804:76-420(-)